MLLYNPKRVFIQCESTGIPSTIDVYNAMDGFYRKGYEITKFSSWNELVLIGFSEKDIIVAGLSISRLVFNYLGKEVPYISYPRELHLYYSKLPGTFFVRDVKEYLKSEDKLRIKPVKDKLFKPFIANKKDIEDLCNIFPNEEVYVVYDIPDIISEYRVYIIEDKVVAIKQYKGELYGAIANIVSEVQRMVYAYKSSPKAYTIDIGITTSGKIDIIEVTDGYSLGSYGMDCDLYADFLEKRREEIMNIQ